MEKISDNQKLLYCDFVRTILMISVVVGHSVDLWMGDWFNQTPVTENNILRGGAFWINSVHIYAFTLLSGYLFYYLKFEKEKYNDYVSFILNKAKRLIIPYVFASFIWVAPIYAYFYNARLLTLFRRFVLCEGPSQLWFLIMLFGVFVVFYPMAYFLESHTYVSIFMMVVFFGISLLGDHFLPNYFQIWTICGYVPFFWLGFIIRKREQDGKMFEIPIFGYVLADIVLFGLYLYLMNCEGTLLRFLFYSEGFVLHIIGAILAFRILSYIGKHINLNNRVFQLLKTSSMGVYLFHQQIIFFVIDFFNGKISSWSIAVLCFVVSLTLSLLITQILLKFKITRLLIGSN